MLLRQCRWKVSVSLLCVAAGFAVAGCEIPDPDLDGDGFPESQDCNDSDTRVNPGAEDLCYDGVDQDCSDGDRIDCDGDGVRPLSQGGADCDDANSSIYPGAEEIPYDTIDQDCEDGDLIDLDGDGVFGSPVGGADCNDANASIFPGASEVPYDQIDQDCDGADLSDVDGDGQSAVDVGGEDCADNDPAVFAGAPETAYDSVDQDCSGNDLTDVDSDGFDGGELGVDCDDQDAAIHPDAAEVPYDAADQDCDGADLEDVDADGALPEFLGGNDCNDQDSLTYAGALEVLCNAVDEDCDGLFGDQDCDGHLLRDLGGDDCDDADRLRFPGNLEEVCNARDEDCDELLADQDCDGATLPALGGDDCDDANAYRHTGALEFVNELDDNCDGLIDEAQAVIEATARLKGSAGDEAGRAVAVGDLDDDGFMDLAVGAPGHDGAAGAVYIYPGGAGAFVDGELPGAPYIIFGWEAGDRFGSAVAMGDVTGDGVVDLLAGAPGAADRDSGQAVIERPGQLYVFSGGSAGTLPWGPKARVDSALWTISGMNDKDELGGSVAFVGDVAGNPVGDFVAGAPGASFGAASGAGAAYLFLGGSTGEPFRVADDAAAGLRGQTAKQRVGTVVAGLGDVNGDGLSDVAVGAPDANGGSGFVALFFGRFDPSGWSLEAPSVLLTAEPGCGLGPVMGNVDLNGDGFQDVLVGAPAAGTNAQGKVYLLYGRSDWALSAVDLSITNDGRFFGESDGDFFGSTMANGFIDADGQIDVLVGSSAHAGGGKIYLFRGGAWGIRQASAADAVWLGAHVGQAAGSALGVADLNNDGEHDLVVGAPGDASGGTMAGTAFVYYWY